MNREDYCRGARTIWARLAGDGEAGTTDIITYVLIMHFEAECMHGYIECSKNKLEGLGMKKFTLYLGLNDKDSKVQKIGTVEAYKITENILRAYVDGATIYEASGIYKHDNGEFTTEKTLRIELLFVERKDVLTICGDLKRAFNQESIALQEEIVNSELV